jgi:Leucine-rich repeat (LRR) protein
LTVLYPAIGWNFPQLQVLNASNNLITMADNQTFASIITAAQVIDLSHNKIGGIGRDKFAQLKHLRRLDLSYILIKLFDMSLASSQLLEYLDLSNNLLNSLPQFTIEGLNKIALANTSKKVHVDLTGNSLI